MIYFNFTKESDIVTGVKAKSSIFNIVCVFFILHKNVTFRNGIWAAFSSVSSFHHPDRRENLIKTLSDLC